MSFTSPTALWCLLGIPAVLAIHFLQRRSRREVITTLFLLQQMRRESETGNRFERLRPSIPLWLQLLMVLLFTWLLAGPRWMKNEAVQRIAIVMDSSASMQAFLPQAEEAVRTT
ncbi:MAG: BatA domain-containing protein, partial [Prosthecobacter sp.]